MERWQRRVALVTIGRGVAERLLADGMRVAACARRKGRVEEIAEAGEQAG